MYFYISDSYSFAFFLELIYVSNQIVFIYPHVAKVLE